MKLTTEYIRQLIKEELSEVAVQAAQQGQQQQGQQDQNASPGATTNTRAEKESRSPVAAMQPYLRKIPTQVAPALRQLAQKDEAHQRAVSSVVLQQFAGMTPEQVDQMYTIMKQAQKQG